MAFNSVPSVPHHDSANLPAAFLPVPSEPHQDGAPAAPKPKRRKSMRPHFCEPSADGGFVLSDPDGRVWGRTRKRKH